MARMRSRTAATAVLHRCTSSVSASREGATVLEVAKLSQSGEARAVSVKVLRAIQPLKGAIVSWYARMNSE